MHVRKRVLRLQSTHRWGRVISSATMAFVFRTQFFIQKR